MANKKKADGERRFAVAGKNAWVIRNPDGTFKKWVNKKRSMAADRRKKAKTEVKSGYGHKGDRPRSTK